MAKDVAQGVNIDGKVVILDSIVDKMNCMKKWKSMWRIESYLNKRGNLNEWHN